MCQLCKVKLYRFASEIFLPKQIKSNQQKQTKQSNKNPVQTLTNIICEPLSSIYIDSKHIDCRHGTSDLARISKLSIFLNRSARPKLSKMAKMALNSVKWSKMVVFLPDSDDNCLSKKMGGWVAS